MDQEAEVNGEVERSGTGSDPICVVALGRRVELSQKEFALLRALAASPTRVYTKEELLRDVWGFRSMGISRLKARYRVSAAVASKSSARRSIALVASLAAFRPMQQSGHVGRRSRSLIVQAVSEARTETQRGQRRGAVRSQRKRA